MKDDDPEKRIRELEQELADVTRTPQSTPPYMGDATYTSGAPYGSGFPPPRRNRQYPWLIVLIVVGIAVPTIISFVVHSVRPSPSRTATSNGATATSDPTAVPQRGELRVSGNNETRTIACNDGKLILAGYNSTYTITGHCSSLTVGGYHNNVTVDSADTLESTGYGNMVINRACNNGNLKLSSYGIEFTVTGHCASLAISSYNNKVTVDSVDGIIVSGYGNNITYRSGTPKVTDSGYDNNIHQG